MSLLPRFPFTHSELMNEMMGKNLLDIVPLSPGGKPVPYENFKRGRSDWCKLVTIDGEDTPWWLLWYFMEFIGHLEFIDKDFETFRDVICERENPAATGKRDFTNYLASLITDSKSVYNKHLYIHFQVMWEQCSPDREEAWNQKLGDLREAFNRYILKRMTSYESSEKRPDPVFNNWKNKLLRIYGENWESFIFQCANFDELGQFIIVHNKVYRKNEDAKLLFCRLNLPETRFTIAGHPNQQLAEIDNNSNIRIWARGVKVDGNTYVYPATPDVWTTGSRSIMSDYKRHTSIFPNSDISQWLSECKNKGVEVKFLVIYGDVRTDNYENDKIMTNPEQIVACSNKNDLVQRITPKPTRPVCGKDESQADFADRMLEWSNRTYLTTGGRTYK